MLGAGAVAADRDFYRILDADILDKVQQSSALKELDLLWVSGRQQDYFTSGGDFLARFVQLATNDESQIAGMTNAVEGYLQKSGYKDGEIYSAAIFGKVRVLSEYSQLLRVKPNLVLPPDIERYVAWAGGVLKEIDAKYDRSYTPQAVYFNTPLPAGVTGFGGMDPKGIQDPVMRAAYQKAIDENEAKSRANNLQDLLKYQRKRIFDEVVATDKTLEEKALRYPRERFRELVAGF